MPNPACMMIPGMLQAGKNSFQPNCAIRLSTGTKKVCGLYAASPVAPCRCGQIFSAMLVVCFQ